MEPSSSTANKAVYRASPSSASSSAQVAPAAAAAAPTPVAAPVLTVPVVSVPATIFLKLGDDEDVIECDLPVKTYAELVYFFYNEYGLKPQVHKIAKIRKLPNILVRNDKDVARIKAGDTLQLVLADVLASD